MVDSLLLWVAVLSYTETLEFCIFSPDFSTGIWYIEALDPGMNHTRLKIKILLFLTLKMGFYLPIYHCGTRGRQKFVHYIDIHITYEVLSFCLTKSNWEILRSHTPKLFSKVAMRANVS